MPSFSKEFIERVRAANPIEKIIGEHVNLKKAGKNLKGLCPFHNEKTPSFTVSPDKGFYHCFGCGKGGSVFNFLMEFEGISFQEAVEELAHKAGLPIEHVGGKKAGAEFATQRRRKKDRLFSLCKLAENFFIKSLLANEGKIAREYIASRQINDETVRAFRLGYAPDSWDALRKTALKSGFTDDELVLTGLAVRSNDGNNVYDRFRNRLIFPIWDLAGNVIAFGGRALGDIDPKYLNSPETPLYIKSKVLYPIFHTKRAIQKKKLAILCEGYMDALALAQNRFTYVVASCGTALTDSQAGLIKRFTDKIVVAYDGDTAGQEASLKSISVLVGQGIDVFIAQLSGGEDPDSFIKKFGAEKFAELIDNATPFFTYLLNDLKKSIDVTTPQGKKQLCDKVFPLIAKFDDEILRGGYLDELANFINTDRTRLEKALNEFIARERRVQGKKSQNTQAQEEFKPPVKLDLAEETLIATILSNDEALKFANENLDVEYIEHPVAHELVRRMYDECQKGEWRGAQSFLDEINDDEARLITGILSKVPENVDKIWRQIVEDCKKVLYNKAYSNEIERLKEQLAKEKDIEKIKSLQMQIISYQKEKMRHSRIKKINLSPTTI